MKKTIYCFLSCLVLSALVVAQVSTSSITGTVQDASGAIVINAKVVVTNEKTGISSTTATTSRGDYGISGLPPGTYTINVSHEGFSTFSSAHNELQIGAPLVVNGTLKVGSATEVVQVESSYERIETTNATISDVMTTKQIQNLPLNGRNPLSLLTLEPGVVQRTNNGAGSGTHVFGSRDRAHNVTVDGIDANESTVPNPQSNLQRLNPDNVQEFRAVTLNATAETGRNSGANVMVGTRQGTNAFHGAVFYFNRNSAFNANEWFNNYENKPRPDLKLNQYGFDVGGPIFKNKTFFFGSFQGNKIKQTAPISQSFGLPATYTSSLRNGIFTFVRGTVQTPTGAVSSNSSKLVDAAGNLLPGIPQCGAANTVASKSNCVDTYNIFANAPAGLALDPATSALIRSLPLPNNFTGRGDSLNNGGFNWNPPSMFTGPHYMVRVDHTFGPNDNVFVRYLQNSFDTKQGDFLNGRPQVYPGFAPLGEVGRIGKNLAIDYRHTFSPSLINDLTLGFNRFAFNFTFGESNPNFGDPTKVPPWTDSCLFNSFLNTDAGNCISPHTKRAITTPQIVDNITWVKGAHTLRAGINFRFYIHNDSRGFFGSSALVPAVLFDQSARQGSGFTNIPAAIGPPPPSGPNPTAPNSGDINRLQQAIVELYGLAGTVQKAFAANFTDNTYSNPRYATVYTRAHQYDSFIQDEWRVRPNVTINVGLRWEFNPAPYDAKQTLVPNVAADTSGAVTYVKADRWFQNDNATALGPRLGIAWSPDSKTAIRAGYSWLFDTLSTFQVTAIAGKMPGFLLSCKSTVSTSGTVQTTAGCTSPANLTGRISSGFPIDIPAPSATPSQALTVPIQSGSTAPGVGAFDPNLKNPSVHEWSFTIQRELPMKFVAEIGYVGKRGTHLYRAYDLNQIRTDQAGFITNFTTARDNVNAGCNADGTTGTAGAACATAVGNPALFRQLLQCSATGRCGNLDSSTFAGFFQLNSVGQAAARFDSNFFSNLVAAGFPANYFRPNPQFGQIFYQDSGGDSYYHGGFFTLRRRFEQGLDFGLSYTYSKSIDALSVDPTGAATGGGLSTTSFSRTPTDIRDFRLDRSRSDFDNRHVLLTNMVYELPFGKQKRWLSGSPTWLNEIVGGWQFTGIFNYQSGEPYTISSGNRTTNGSHVSSALVKGSLTSGDLHFVSGTEGPVVFETGPLITNPTDPNYNCKQVTNTTTFFCIPAPGQNGSGRNLIQGPGLWNLDSGLAKNFDITEIVKLQFRVEAFNLLNHVNFENPRNSTSGSATITSSAFGQTCCITASLPSSATVIATGEPNRVLQLGLKIIF